MKTKLTALACMAALSACGAANDPARERAEDAMERQAQASAVAAGATVAALGLTEAQLLDAELRGPGDVELGDVARVERNADGNVERLLIEIEDSDPDRFVHIPIQGLTTVARGNDIDLVTTMTREQLAALPDAPLTTP